MSEVKIRTSTEISAKFSSAFIQELIIKHLREKGTLNSPNYEVRYFNDIQKDVTEYGDYGPSYRFDGIEIIIETNVIEK